MASRFTDKPARPSRLTNRARYVLGLTRTPWRSRTQKEQTMTATSEPAAVLGCQPSRVYAPAVPASWADALAAYCAAESALEDGAHLARIRPDNHACEAAEAEYAALVDRTYDAMHALMAIPAPDRQALALKFEIVDRRGNAGLPDEAQWQAIRADTLRLLAA